jgi:hypothetical protein
MVIKVILEVHNQDSHEIKDPIWYIHHGIHKVFLGVWFFDYFCYNLWFWDFENVQNEVTLL